jgi:hypothetical protein
MKTIPGRATIDGLPLRAVQVGSVQASARNVLSATGPPVCMHAYAT